MPDSKNMNWYDVYAKTIVDIPKKDMKKVYDMVEKGLGLTPDQWDAYRHGIAIKESQGNKFTTEPTLMYYMAKGGSNDAYDGRYQLGEVAKKDAAKYLGEKYPGHTDKARKDFRDNPLMQELYMAAYTIKNHQYLSQANDSYDANKYLLSKTPKRLKLLGFAHNQGHNAAKKYIVTGKDSEDGFKTKGTLYGENIINAASQMNVDFN